MEQHYEPIARKTLFLNYERGGISLPDINTKILAMGFQKITKTISKLDQYWKYLLVYWIGITLRIIHQPFGSNIYIHTTQLPQIYRDLRKQFLQYKTKLNWNITELKNIYWGIKEGDTHTPTIQRNLGLTHIDFSHIYTHIRNLHVKEKYKDILYKFLHNALFRHYIPQPCKFCKQHIQSTKHIFLECKEIQGFKEFIKLQIDTEFNVQITDAEIQYLNVDNLDILLELLRYIRSIFSTYINYEEDENLINCFAKYYHSRFEDIG